MIFSPPGCGFGLFLPFDRDVLQDVLFFNCFLASRLDHVNFCLSLFTEAMLGNHPKDLNKSRYCSKRRVKRNRSLIVSLARFPSGKCVEIS